MTSRNGQEPAVPAAISPVPSASAQRDTFYLKPDKRAPECSGRGRLLSANMAAPTGALAGDLPRICVYADVGQEPGDTPPASVCWGSRPALCQSDSDKETTVTRGVMKPR